MVDPVQQSTLTPYGARLSEYVLQQTIAFSLQKMQDTIDTPGNVIDSLFRMLPDQVRDQIKLWIREHKNIPVAVNWPRLDLSLPWVAVVSAGESDDPKTSFLGDDLGVEMLGDAARSIKGIGLACNTQIYFAAQDPILLSCLVWIIRFSLFTNKDELAKRYDLHNLTMSAQDIQWRQELWPSFCYMKVLSLNYTSFFDFAEAAQAAMTLSLSLRVTAPGSEVETEVPFED